ncbi:MAG: T9SS type A sorting domain-containing protein [Bacteroidota bacterium]
MRFIFLIVLSIVFIWNSAQGQISEGGFPVGITTLKSAEVPVIEMPAFNPGVNKSLAEQDISSENRLKPFKFAHTFEVNMSPANSGNWFINIEGHNIWKLKIRSAGAKSLNLIFDNFRLPQNARLFLYNEKENYYLGAFSSVNNKASGKFAVSPVAGDEITIQYEVPATLGTPDNFEIIRVNHDYVGILKSERRPLGITAGACNVDINCEIGDNWNELKNSVCRLIVDGREICSGTLINNTSEDEKPYIISAAHCYDEWDYAETTVYTFNYESPYCAPLDGDPSNSISGALMKAQFDSLDFALVELSLVPPPSFRPYYAGWDRSSNLPDSAVSIHHPQGDIKKIAFENDPVVHSNFNSKYTQNGFIKVPKWDDGVTEVGSSGGPLFNTDKNIIGTLTGGAAVCDNPVNDFYSRFDMQWDYKSDSSKQLKFWLDPVKSGVETVFGKLYNTDDDLCKAFTNLTDYDEHSNVVLKSSGEFSGYWGGTNGAGITEFVERFYIPGNETLDGVSIGVGKIDLQSGGEDSKITVNVYNGKKLPETLIYSKVVSINTFAEDAMNYIQFDEFFEPADTFFVGFGLTGIQPQDTFVIYQSLRKEADAVNQFYFKLNDEWNNFKASNEDNNAIVNVMELVACNYDDQINDTQVVEIPETVWIYPNPTYGNLTLASDQKIVPETISVYNTIGQEVGVNIINAGDYRVKINLKGKTPGVYFVRFNYSDTFVTRKFSFVPR